MTGATRFKQPGVFAVTRRIGDPHQKVVCINVQSCSDREHDAGCRRHVLSKLRRTVGIPTRKRSNGVNGQLNRHTAVLVQYRVPSYRPSRIAVINKDDAEY